MIDFRFGTAFRNNLTDKEEAALDHLLDMLTSTHRQRRVKCLRAKRLGGDAMILKDISGECQRCANLKVWNIHKNGELDYCCRCRPPYEFISKDLRREPCEGV